MSDRVRQLNDREVALILAGLRLLERQIGDLPNSIAEYLLDAGIDDLNTKQRRSALVTLDRLVLQVNLGKVRIVSWRE